MDDTEKLFGIRDDGEALLAVGASHFQSVTICNGFISLVREALLHDAPINLRIGAAGEDGDDVHDGEIPLLFGFVPCAADLFFFKKGQGVHGLMWLGFLLA